MSEIGLPNGRDEQDFDQMTTAEKVQAIKRAIFELAVGRVKNYMLGRTQVTYFNLPQLRQLQRDYEAELAAENADANCMFGTTVSFFDRR